MMFAKPTALILVGLSCCIAAGCSMCCGVYDYAYPTFGGKHERVDPEYGRVGSIYSDPLADPGVPALTNADVPPEPAKQIDIDLDDEFQDDSEDQLQAPETDDGSSTRGVYRRDDAQWR